MTQKFYIELHCHSEAQSIRNMIAEVIPDSLIKSVVEVDEAAEQPLAPDAAKPRRRMVACPECETMFGVELS